MSGPRRLDLRDVAPDGPELEVVLSHLRRDGLIAYPTETVYGFGGLVRPEAVRRLARLKRRAPDRPFLLLVPGDDAVPELGWNAAARVLADAFWPGPLTLVLSDPDARFPPGVRSPEGTVAVRHTSHPLAGGLVARLGEPLTSTSANLPGEPAALDGGSALEAARAAGAGELVWVLDAGALPSSAPSTIVDCSGATPRIRRAGAIPLRQVQRMLPEIDEG